MKYTAYITYARVSDDLTTISHTVELTYDASSTTEAWLVAVARATFNPLDAIRLASIRVEPYQPELEINPELWIEDE